MMTIAAGMRVGIAMDTAEIVPDRELIKSRIFVEFIRPMGGRYGMVAAPFSRSLLAICRPPSARRFTHSDIRCLQTALPQLEAALRLKRHLVELEAHTAALEGVLDELGVGVLIAARSGRTLYANRLAEAALRTMRDAAGFAGARPWPGRGHRAGGRSTSCHLTRPVAAAGHRPRHPGQRPVR